MKKQTKAELQKQIDVLEETITNLRYMVGRRLKVIADESRIDLAESIKLDAARYKWLREKTAELFMVTHEQMDNQIDEAMK